MRIFSSERLAELVVSGRKAKGLSQAELAQLTGLNRATISRIEQQQFMPSILQLQALGQALSFEADEVFVE